MNQPLPFPDSVEWRVDTAPVAYPEALADMEARAAAIQAGEARERVWLLEHPPLYTAGTSADPAELIDPRFPVHDAGRGGRYTYHGPGQRIGYLNIDLGRRGKDVRNFVHHLEGWMIAALGDLGVEARRAEGRIGIWTDDAQGREAKIGALGIRVRRWVTLHGFSINVDPDLSHFSGIVPCGISEYPVTSIAALGGMASMAALDGALHAHFPAFLNRLGRCGTGVEQCGTDR
ncbi:Octanoate-[acyl-carrier-protein]-protein-N-octanoyltransferase [Sphingobium indicum BiD32]|uniref:Octanoyltransferase n=1 Tax=Sphingobium indicum BiD32 TaxID=1301087 RepID=N1MN19_9SPHN|nr:lipoyl(octanoyl) transferase LipB [Sphingobium indicum]CCW18114.1 Octanoate-[acyl-carrier-protein]-protein-N-octanoyltransferase [Sphingobium indicum BiD32]